LFGVDQSGRTTRNDKAPDATKLRSPSLSVTSSSSLLLQLAANHLKTHLWAQDNLLHDRNSCSLKDVSLSIWLSRLIARKGPCLNDQGDGVDLMVALICLSVHWRLAFPHNG
jgi:hypothetical protein